MDKKRTIQRNTGKKKGKPKIRFNFWVMFIIFFLSFCTCFVLYMLAANFNEDFFENEFNAPTVAEQEQSVTDTTDDNQPQEQETTAESESTGIANPVPQSPETDKAYFEKSCLITDSTLIKMSENTDFKDVIGNAQLNASNCNDQTIDSSYGNVTIYETLKLKKPENVYIMLGSDLGTSSEESMISAYTTLVTNLHAAMPEMKIYIMQIPPAIYDTETLTNEMINNYNNKLLAIADSVGVYCIDTNTALKSGSGALEETYWSYDELALSAEGYKKICSYILTHIA